MKTIPATYLPYQSATRIHEVFFEKQFEILRWNMLGKYKALLLPFPQLATYFIHSEKIQEWKVTKQLSFMNISHS